ncbi:hypothetical protein AAMO2058_001712300 [Amorphochlora amoebiformis]
MYNRGRYGYRNRSDAGAGGSGRYEEKSHGKGHTTGRVLGSISASKAVESVGFGSRGPEILRLERLLGFTGQFHGSVRFHPVEDSLLYTVDMMMISIDLKAGVEGKQRFFKGHDAPICCLDISPCGKFIASGQKASPRYKGEMAPIIVWSWDGKILGQFSGLKTSVLAMGFSPDSRYLMASGENMMLYIWDLDTGSVLVAHRSPKAVTALGWGPMTNRRSRKKPTYSIVTCASPIVRCHTLEYETRSMHYVLKTRDCNFPSRGLLRTYTCTVFDDLGIIFLCGTDVGDILIFHLQGATYRTRIPVCSAGIQAVLKAKGNVMYVAGGDGSIKKLSGRDRTWNLVSEGKLSDRIISLSLSAKEDSLIAGMTNGDVYSIPTSNLKFPKLIMRGHIRAINDIDISSEGRFCTISDDKTLRFWDTSHKVLSVFQGPIGGKKCTFGPRGTIISGWADGSLRCSYASDGKQIWVIPSAHKGTISSLTYADQTFLTAGEDGSVRIWSISTRRMLGQYLAHNGPVGEVSFDVHKPHLIKSYGARDRSIATYNIKDGRKVISHMIQNGSYTSMCQHPSTGQLITGLSHGYITFWSPRDRNPSRSILDSSRSKISCVALSKDGRYLAVSGEDYRLRVYEVSSMKMIGRCDGHIAPVLKVSFSPDQRRIVSVGEDAAICIWNFRP